MIVRKVAKKDLIDIWLWRNNKMSIYFSKNKRRITLESHKKWFNKNLKNTRVKFYLGYLIKNKKIKKIGVVRFNIKSKYALVSINLSPIMRNKGLSYVLLTTAIKRFLKFKKTNLIAEIKKNNFASIKCFLKNKFYFLERKNSYNFYQRSLG
jgi:RimJ/RimL family protein N-acetyltransferase